MFIDRAKIIVVSGAGGDGVVAFRREKYVPRGGPSGGDGGKGGSVIIRADSNQNTLINFRRHRKFAAKAGENGGAKEMFGKNAEDVFVDVPLGTMVYDDRTGELLADMTQNGQQVMVAKGGHGGRGNSHFATSAVRAPTYAEKGEPGEEKNIRLELKVLADVGLLGFPSVGKSSLLRKVSGAKPEVAAYHFTTLNPVLGVVSLDSERSFVMADIPGLIEGASQGTGLGDEFLRHVERTKVLIHVLDAAGSEGRDPLDDFRIINNELELYSPALAQKKQIVAANKIDLIEDSSRIEDLRKAIESKGYKFFPVCTLNGEGLKPLLEAAWTILQEEPEVSFEPTEKDIVYEVQKDEFLVEKKDDIYYVTGKRVEKLVGMTNFEDYVSLRRFERAWRFMGLDKLLRKQGIHEGDTVNLYGVEFTYSESKDKSENTDE
ncbi:GTPase ObgE [Dialister sp.]|uniref:GTPase ObgE n=1 Tax=Dialister sp. TaxID=1955814 RepID=UPI002E802B32|nr:GTPase ObgE [Dialister sp.]MEE3452012.1 GTPase ObgE [Dialister sp.]